jgi:N-acetylglucosamine kinase-like BadF-type ATPase
MSTILIADSGSTKAAWCLIRNGRKKTLSTQGISPYFMDRDQIVALLREELVPQMGRVHPDEIYYYGTGCAAKSNVQMIRKALRSVFPEASVTVDHDLMGAARALCGHEKGVACILGTGSNSCYYNGKRIVKNSPGLGFILGDEGSGAYMGKKVVQYFLYETFDTELRDRFMLQFNQTPEQILDSVYRQPLPNRYLAGFAGFLAENRGHYMVENIIEDSFHEFIFHHVYKYKESWSLPVHFIGSIAYHFQDVLAEVCAAYKLTLGQVMDHPLDGLVRYHLGK